MILLVADEQKKAVLFQRFAANNPVFRYQGLTDRILRTLCWLAPLIYAAFWFLRNKIVGEPIRTYQWVSLIEIMVLLFLLFSLGLWFMPRANRFMQGPTLCWRNREETLQRIDEDHLLYCYRNEYNEQVRELIRIREYGYFNDGLRLAINGEISRTITDARGRTHRGRKAFTINLYDYFTPGLRELVQ